MSDNPSESDLRLAIRALCALEHNVCRYERCNCGNTILSEYRRTALAVLRATARREAESRTAGPVPPSDDAKGDPT